MICFKVPTSVTGLERLRISQSRQSLALSNVSATKCGNEECKNRRKDEHVTTNLTLQ
jgi:hypothetical protein